MQKSHVHQQLLLDPRRLTARYSVAVVKLSASVMVNLSWTCVTLALFVIPLKFNVITLALISLYAVSNQIVWNHVFDERSRPCGLMFWLFNSQFVLLPAIAQVGRHAFYWTPYSLYTQSEILAGVAVLAIGMAGVLLGQRAKRMRQLAFSTNCRTSSTPRYFAQMYEPNNSRCLFVTTIVLALLALAIVKTGADTFMVSRGVVFESVADNVNLGFTILLPRAVAAALLVMCVATVRAKSNRTPAFFALFLVVIAENLVVNWPLALPRYWFFGLAIATVCSIVNLKPVWKSTLVASFFASQFTLIPLYSQWTRNKGWAGMSINDLREYLLHGDVSMFQSIVDSLIYVHEAGFLFGKNLSSAAFFFIPRAFWEKELSLGTSAAEHLNMPFTLVSSHIFAELYADFGIVSLLSLSFLIGKIVSAMDAHYEQGKQDGLASTGFIGACLLAGFIPIIARGSLLGVIAPIATMFGFVFLFRALTTKKAVN